MPAHSTPNLNKCIFWDCTSPKRMMIFFAEGAKIFKEKFLVNGGTSKEQDGEGINNTLHMKVQ